MKVVTHNIKRTLSFEETKVCVHRALATRPQMVGLQEIPSKHDGVLKLHGEFVDRRHLQFVSKAKKKYLICRGKSNVLPVLLKRSYVKKIHEIKTITVAPRRIGVRPTPGTFVLFTNRFDRKIALLNTHPTAHHEKAAYKRAFREAGLFCNRFAREWIEEGDTPIILMDGNGLNHVDHLTSCWLGNESLPTGPGGNTIDIVFATKNADDVHTFPSPSDHNGVVVHYENFL